MEQKESTEIDAAARAGSCGAHAADECSAGGCVQASGVRHDEAPGERPDRLGVELTVDDAARGRMARRAVTAEETAKILSRHHAERWPVGTIGTQLGRHHDTVERVLAQSGLDVHKESTRARLVDPFIPFLKETLAKYPRLRASRLWSMAKARGYTGSKSGFRSAASPSSATRSRPIRGRRHCRCSSRSRPRSTWSSRG